MTGNTPNTEWCLNTNHSVFGILASRRSKYFAQAWIHATLQLKPSKGAQLVDFSDASKGIKKALPDLVVAGLLKPKASSPMKYYVPRSKAFASMEESFDGIRWRDDAVN
jgi:hypothetical protein